MLGYTIEPNLTYESPDGTFYISYNPVDISLYGDKTTALVYGQMQHFYVLNGDHRKEYKELIPLGWQACFDYFISNQDKINKYSEKKNCR
jgi:hypothetical protein